MKAEILSSFENIPYFTIEGFRQVTGAASSDQVVRNLLHRWVKAGHLVQLKNGVYMTRRFFERQRGDYLFSAAVSSTLIPQSYVSLEYILQRHNLLTEVTYPITCITLKVTRKIVNAIGTYWYRNIRPELYQGFTITDYFGIRVAQATLGKALFDYLYLRPLPATFRTMKLNLAEELRLNLDELSGTDRNEFALFVESSQSRKMAHILNNFRSNVWHP